jgi:hypothetical protein
MTLALVREVITEFGALSKLDIQRVEVSSHLKYVVSVSPDCLDKMSKKGPYNQLFPEPDYSSTTFFSSTLRFPPPISFSR